MDRCKITQMIISAVEDESGNKTSVLIEFFNRYYSRGFTEKELKVEAKKVENVVKICRNIVLDLKKYLRKH